jgi:hypothetical protein
MKKQILFLKLYINSKLYFWKFYKGPGQPFSVEPEIVCGGPVNRYTEITVAMETNYKNIFL